MGCLTGIEHLRVKTSQQIADQSHDTLLYHATTHSPVRAQEDIKTSVPTLVAAAIHRDSHCGCTSVCTLDYSGWGCAAHRAPEPDSTMDKNRHATPAHMCAQLPARDCNSPSSDSIPPDPLQILLKPAHPCDSFTRVNGEIACCKGTFSDEATYEVSQPGTDTCLGIPRADRGVAAAAI